MTPRDRLARLHCVNALLHALTGHDLYLADQMLQAVDAAASREGEASGEDFTSTLAFLHEQLLGTKPEAGFSLCDGARGSGSAGPLFLRAELLDAVRRNAAKRRATIMVANLPDAEAPMRKGHRASGKRAREHADLVAVLRDLVVRRANPRTALTLLFV